MGVLEYITSLGDNPYFGAGAGLFGIGLLTQFGKKGSVILSTALKRKYILTMEVPCSDQSYGWLMTWITARAAKKTQHLSVQTLFQKSDVTGKVTTKFDFIPSPGIHIMMYKNRFIRVHRERENKMVNFDTGTPWETVTLSTLGTSKQLFIDMLHEAREFGLQGSEGLTSIYKPAGGPPPKWEVFGQPMRPRPLDSVILGEGVSNKLVADVQEFISNSKWYQDRGIPYRRGYLLYGPPGCGKSSFITALAGELQHNICLLNLSMFGMNDDWLSKLMSEAPAESIILLEDIDAAFVSREDDDVKYRGMTRLTLSGMLNAMDGVITSEGRISPPLLRIPPLTLPCCPDLMVPRATTRRE